MGSRGREGQRPDQLGTAEGDQPRGQPNGAASLSHLLVGDRAVWVGARDEASGREADAMSAVTLSVADICERYGVSEHTVLGWIRSGDLKAVNVGRRSGAKKPRWRITQEAVTAFEAL